MTIAQLAQQIQSKQTYLCIGLDTDVEKLPLHLRAKSDAAVTFNKAIIDATKDFCVSYKINTAFYESQGIQGWQAMEETVRYIPATHFTIADAKRGDIGNTSAHYAKTFFETLPFDAVTVDPYMGEDSVRPFLEYKDKVTIVLGLTSNQGANDFEMQPVITNYQKQFSNATTLSEQNISDGLIKDANKGIEPVTYLYETVLRKVSSWGSSNNTMFVIGATQTEQFSAVRAIIPDHFLLVPGVGAQGGSLQAISHSAMNRDCGLLVNASRAVIYAGSGEDFAEKATEAAKAYHLEMKLLLQQKGEL